MKLALRGISVATIVLILLEMADLIGELLPKLFLAILLFAYALQNYREKDTAGVLKKKLLFILNKVYKT